MGAPTKQASGGNKPFSPCNIQFETSIWFETHTLQHKSLGLSHTLWLEEMSVQLSFWFIEVAFPSADVMVEDSS